MMYLDSSRHWLIYVLWGALLVGGGAVTGWLLIAAVRTRFIRWLRVLAAAVCVIATLSVGWIWINAASARGYSCTMEVLSTALASGVSTPDERACLDKSRLRFGLSASIEFIVLAGGIRLARRRQRPSDDHRLHHHVGTAGA